MASPSVARLVEATPQYVRLPPGGSNYTIELNADLLQRVTGEIAAAEKLGVETGGLLLGSWQLSPVLTVRVEDFELIAPGRDAGLVYLLSPQQQEQFAATRLAAAHHRAASGGLVPIGFFRSHLRSGPLALSLADKGLLWKQFRSDPYLALLIEGHESYKASLFLSTGGQVALHSSFPVFPSGNEVSGPLREVVPGPLTGAPLEAGNVAAVEQSPEANQPRRVRPLLLSLCSVLFFAIGIVLWPAWETTFGGPWAITSSADMAFTIQRHGQNLEMVWNRKMPEISRAEGATLTITNGARRSELQLGKDDLKFGTVAYVYKGGKVEANLALKMQDATSLVQSAIWQKP